MKRTLLYLLAALVATGTNSIAQSPTAVEGHDAFIKSLQELKRKYKLDGYDLRTSKVSTEFVKRDLIKNVGISNIPHIFVDRVEEDNTLVLEYKTGPYYGQASDKEFIDD